MRGCSDGEDVDDDSTDGDSITNKGNKSTTKGDDNGDADASSSQGPKEKPSPRETAAGCPSRTKTKQWKAKEAKIAKMAATRAKAVKAKAAAAKKKAAAPSPKKRVTKGYWSGYTGRGEHQALGRMIADTLQLCCDTSDPATIKFL